MDLEADFKADFLPTCEVCKPYILCMQNHFTLISDQDLVLSSGAAWIAKCK